MMKALILLSFFIMNSVKAEVIEWQKPYCQNCEQKSSLENTIPAHIVELGELMKQGEAVETMIDKQFDQWSDFVRWVNKKPTNKSTTKEFESRWEELVQEAEALIEVNRELGAAKRRFNVCINNCSAYRKVELQDDIDRLEKLRFSLSALSPWWISEEFKDITDKASEKYEYVPDPGTLKSAFTASMSKFFKDAFEIKKDISEMKTKYDRTLQDKKNSIPYNNLVGNFIQHHGNTLDILVKRSIVSGNKNLCQIANMKYSFDKTEDYGKTALKYGLTAVSLLTGPEGLVAALTVRSTIAGVSRAAIATVRAPSVFASLALTGQALHERAQIEKKCRTDLAAGKLESVNIQVWENCLKSEEAARITALLSSISVVTGPTFPKVTQLMKRINKAPVVNYGIRLMKRPNNKTLAILDLSEARALRMKNLDESSERYWEFVGEVYRKRLNLSDDEIKGFIQSSKQYESRTHLILQTSGGGPTAGKIEGGVGLVTSGKEKDLLPLEKATGVKLPRNNGKIAEIVRLTSVSDDHNLMVDLLMQIAKVTKRDGDLTTLFVYTSRIHERLYRKLGVPYKLVGKPIDRDVILQVDVKDFYKAVAQRKAELN